MTAVATQSVVHDHHGGLPALPGDDDVAVADFHSKHPGHLDPGADRVPGVDRGAARLGRGPAFRVSHVELHHPQIVDRFPAEAHLRRSWEPLQDSESSPCLAIGTPSTDPNDDQGT